MIKLFFIKVFELEHMPKAGPVQMDDDEHLLRLICYKKIVFSTIKEVFP